MRQYNNYLKCKCKGVWGSIFEWIIRLMEFWTNCAWRQELEMTAPHIVWVRYY